VSPRRSRNARLPLVLALVLAFLLGGVTHAFADPCADGPTTMPTLPELRRAARRHAKLEDLPGWRGRARTAALLPTLSLRAARALGWDDGGVDTGVPTEVDHDLVFEARLTWRLDRLIYEPAEPRLHVVERDAARARAALDNEMTRLYFQWRRTMVAAEEGDPLKVIDAQEAWAHLDARTGGWLTQRACSP
jgi:hypothetical protein